jgi:DNA-directed RNA polymerase subunit RPC12/RpoP
MASWVLRCPNCSETFVHSEIEDTLTNYFSTERPKFPKGGQTLTCTHCGKESLFQRTDLVYQRESIKRKAAGC